MIDDVVVDTAHKEGYWGWSSNGLGLQKIYADYDNDGRMMEGLDKCQTGPVDAAITKLAGVEGCFGLSRSTLCLPARRLMSPVDS